MQRSDGGQSGRAAIVACRGCCCGNPAKDPDTDHAAELATLQGFASAHPDAVGVRVTDCLGPCEHANVVVVRPSPRGRAHGGRPVWFSRLDARALDLLGAWITDGGPGLAPAPPLLELHRIDRPRWAALRR